jgi:hypothetical protein
MMQPAGSGNPRAGRQPPVHHDGRTSLRLAGGTVDYKG